VLHQNFRAWVARGEMVAMRELLIDSGCVYLSD
jgi:hypothetical protein